MIFQDIHNSDAEKRTQYIQAVKAGDTTTAASIFDEYKSTGKILSAVALDEFFRFCEYIQGLSDTDFKADRIVTATSAPKDLTVGQMYFKEYE